MRAVGEVMSIGKTYKEAFQKAIRSLEKGRYGLGFAKDFHDKTKEELIGMLHVPSSERQFRTTLLLLRKAIPMTIRATELLRLHIEVMALLSM